VHLLDIYTNTALGQDVLDPRELFDINKSDYLPHKTSIVRRLVKQYTGSLSSDPVAGREFLVRAYEVSNETIADYLVLSAYHDFFAIIFIAVGLDQSWEWPPLFGQITQVYSMRRFWSLFWHRLVYRSFHSHSIKISSWFGVEQRTLSSRFINNFLVFFLSGLMHGLVLRQFGVECAWRGSMEHYLLQPVAFMLEGVVQHYWGRFRRNKLSRIQPSVLSALERIVGYTWVLVWLIWEAPMRNFTLIHCNTESFYQEE
jgi:hypothetical protein